MDGEVVDREVVITELTNGGEVEATLLEGLGFMLEVVEGLGIGGGDTMLEEVLGLIVRLADGFGVVTSDIVTNTPDAVARVLDCSEH